MTHEQWTASRHCVTFDDPDSHSPLAYLAARKRVRRSVAWALLTAGAVLLGCFVCWYVG